MTDEDSANKPLGKLGGTEQKPSSIKMQEVKPTASKPLDDSLILTGSMPPKLEAVSAEFKRWYDEGYKDAKDGKPKRKF